MPEAPNPLTCTTLTPTSAAASGTLHASGTAGRAETCVSRVLRVQLDRLTDENWTELRDIARESARFCNAALADHFAQAMGYGMPEEGSQFRRWKGRLSGDVRVALAREAFTTWGRHGAKIRAGEQRLALFDADRAIVCRAEHVSKGRRQRHVWLTEDEAGVSLSLPLLGKDHGGRRMYRLAIDPRCDDYVRPVLEGLIAGEIPLKKVTLVFERPGRKVFALLTYQKRLPAAAGAAGMATLGPLDVSDGSLWLRWEDATGRAQLRNFSDRVFRLTAMKAQFGGIHRRLRAQTRRTGAGHRQAYRRALVKAGSFGGWAHGYLHQWSAEIVGLLTRHGIGALAIGPLEYAGLPMAELVAKLTYKCQEAGIALSRFDPAQPSTERAITRTIAKQRQQATKAKEALRTLRRALKERSIA